MPELVTARPSVSAELDRNGTSPSSANIGPGVAPGLDAPAERRSTGRGIAGRGVARDIDATLGLASAARRWTKTRRRLLLWGMPGIAVVAAVLYFKFHNAASPVSYATSFVRRGDLAVTVTATGTLAAQDTVDVGTEVSGVVDVVAADFNDHVSKGQTLAVLNTDQLQAQIRQGEATLQAMHAAAQQTAATLAEMQPQATRAESLFASGMISRQDLEGARASLARAVAGDANAQAQIAASMAALSAQRTVLAKATIRSPISGVVLQRQVERGRTVAASFQTPVLFVLAADLRQNDTGPRH